MNELERADLHTFERRLKEILRENEPTQHKWRVLLYFLSTLFAFSCGLLYNDFKTYNDRPLIEHLKHNKCFSFLAISMLILLYIVKAQEKAMAKFILAERTRRILAHYALSCNDDGKLLFPDPNTLHTSRDEDNCSMCCDNDEENDDLCIPESEEPNDPYRPYYNQ